MNTNECKADKVAAVIHSIKENFDELFVYINEATLDHTEFILRDKNSCLDCLNWVSGTEYCTKFNARPPVNIIVNAERDCPGFDIDIPF